MEYLPMVLGGATVVGVISVAASTLSARAVKAAAALEDPTLASEDIATTLFKRIAQADVGVGIWEGRSPYFMGAALAVGLRLGTTLPWLACAGSFFVPCGADLFCWLAANLARHLFYRDPPREDHDRAARRLKSYPCAYPNGWYQLLRSDELAAGQVKEVGCLGRDFVVFRGRKTGSVGALDAHCPHLGANLAVGGVVPHGTDCLRCPFHKWTFSGDGKCVRIPHLPESCTGKGVPAKAAAKAWPVCEYYGMILMFYHADDAPPSYWPPKVTALGTKGGATGSGAYLARGTFETRVNMHIQEFAENSADFLHFDPLHGKMMVPFTPYTLPLIDIAHVPGWKPGEKAKPATEGGGVAGGSAAGVPPSGGGNPASPDGGALGAAHGLDESGDTGHLSWFSDAASLTIRGKPIPNTAAHAEITFVGPGSLVMFQFDTPIGGIVMFQSHLPEGPLRQLVRFSWFADPAMPKLLVWYVVGQWLSQWRNDLFVWENKKFARPPVLVKGDGPIQAQRRWFKQFYSESSFQSKEAPALLEW